MQTRRASVTDIDAITPLFDEYRKFYLKDSDLAGAREFLQARLSRDESVIFVAEEGAKICGFTQLYPLFSSVSMRNTWLLNDLFVALEFRKKGVASLLMGAACEFAKATGARGLSLQTARDNNTAQALYEKMGWQRDNTFFTYTYLL